MVEDVQGFLKIMQETALQLLKNTIRTDSHHSFMMHENWQVQCRIVYKHHSLAIYRLFSINNPQNLLTFFVVTIFFFFFGGGGGGRARQFFYPTFLWGTKYFA